MTGEDALCKRCGATIIWAENKKRDGTVGMAPFDKEPNERGFFCLLRRPDNTVYARYVKRGEEWPSGGLPRTSHFATCPNADEFRKKK